MPAKPFVFGTWGATTPFTPDRASGLYRWFKADAIIGLSDGDPVSTWEDSGSGNRDGTAAGSARPTYKTGILNGLPIVRFDGLTNVLTLGDDSALTAAEVFIVIKTDADPPADGAQSGIWEFGTTGALASHYTWTDGNIYEGFGTDTRKTVGNPTPALTSWRTYSVYSAANDWQAFLDGLSIFSTGTNTVAFSTATTLGAGVAVAYRTDGDIAEFIMYDRKLSAAVRTKVWTYINDKYAL
jgi:hypothetical protein